MIRTPLVSVIIPAYNAAHFVAEAIESVALQDRDDVEVLVINDGSPDTPALEAALEPYLDRIRYLPEPHRGLSATRNRGIEEAHGEFLAFLDADDRWLPGLLDRQVALLQETGADLVYCDASFFGDPELDGHTVMHRNPSRGEPDLARLLAGEVVVVMSTVVARASAVRAAGGFDTTLERCEDFDLWVRMLAAGARFTYHTEPLARRRIHDSNLSGNAEAMFGTALRLTDHYAAAHPFSPAEQRRIERRMNQLRMEVHMARARNALGACDANATRAELWAAFAAWRSPRIAAGALAFTLAPGLALRLLGPRYAPARRAYIGGAT